jgi:hypothetical protein
VSPVIEALVAELERPRELSLQVVNHVSGTYGVDRDAMGQFLEEELPKLEDYEHDLILSPLFTPKLADQTIFAQLLGRDSIPRLQWPALIQELAARPIRAQLVTSDNRLHRVVLREVSIERYVHRLRLDASIPEPLLALISQAPPGDHPMLKAVARRLVWESEARRSILERYLKATAGHASYLVGVAELLKITESYRPADAAELLSRIPNWIRVLEEEINAGSGPKPFFSANIEYTHGGERDVRQPDDVRQSAKRTELAFLLELQRLLQTDM